MLCTYFSKPTIVSIIFFQFFIDFLNGVYILFKTQTVKILRKNNFARTLNVPNICEVMALDIDHNFLYKLRKRIIMLIANI